VDADDEKEVAMRGRTMVTAAMVAGSMAVGGLAGAVAFTPGLSLAESDDATQDVVRVCAGGLARFPLVGHPALWGFADGPIAAAADAIGIGPVALLGQLRGGGTIAEVAEAHGVDPDAVVDAVADALRERLRSAVDNGWISEDEADARGADIDALAEAIVNGDPAPFPFPGPFAGTPGRHGRWHGGGFGAPGGWGGDDADPNGVDAAEASLS
jgi:hypothetical protein